MQEMRYCKDISGVKSGRLTALSFIKRENGHTYWNYKCDCGKYVIKRSNNVRNGKVQSCGCLNKEWLKILNKSRTLDNNQSCVNKLYSNYTKNAIERNFSFELTLEQFINFLDKPCHYCGDMFSNEMKLNKNSTLKYNGIDRTNNSIGYIIENCVSCCYKCNKMKMNLNKDEFLKQIIKIHKYV